MWPVDSLSVLGIHENRGSTLNVDRAAPILSVKSMTQNFQEIYYFPECVVGAP